MLSYNRTRLVTNRSDKPVQYSKLQPPSAAKVPPTKSSSTSHTTIDYKTTLAQCQKQKQNPRVQDNKIHQSPLNITSKYIERKNTKAHVIKESIHEQLIKRRQSSQLSSEQLPKKVENYKSPTVGIAFPSIENTSLNSKNNQYSENQTHYENFPVAITSEICVSPTSKYNISDISQAINSVQEAWNNFVHVSRIIGKLECSMVLTKIDHVLNDEYLAYYQKHPFANNAFNEQVMSDRLKMDTLKDKISKAGDLEGVVKNLSKAIESYRMEEKKLMEELKNCKTALTSRRRLAMNSAAVIRDQLLQTSSKLKELYDFYRKSSLELEALENDLALLLNDAHPTYSLLFRYRGDSNKEAAEEELRYMSLVYAIQQRRLGLFMPTAPTSADIYEVDNDSDWLWLLQYTSDNNISCSSSGSSDASTYEPELPNPFARQSATNCFSQDLSSALKLGRHSFEQLYLSMPEINFEKVGNIQSTDKISMDETIERMNGESSLLFLRRLRHRGLHLHMLLGSFSQELTEKLSFLQDLKQRQGCSLIADEFRSPIHNQDESSILSFPAIYKEDPELATTSYDNTMAAQLKKSQKQFESTSKESLPAKQSNEDRKNNGTDMKRGSLLTSPYTKEPAKKVESLDTMQLEPNKTTQFRAKPSDFIDTNVFLSTRKISSLSTRSGGHGRAVSSSMSIDSSADFNVSVKGSATNIAESNNHHSLAVTSNGDNDRDVSPIALLKDLLHSTVKKKLKNKNDGENSDFVQFSTPVNDLLFNYDDLDELNKLIVKYLADKRNMNLSQDSEESLSTFNEVLKVLKVQVLSDLLKRDLAIADEIQASQVRLLTIPAIVDVTPVKSPTTAAIISSDNAGQGETEGPIPTTPHQVAHPPEVDVSLLEQFKRNGEMIFIDPSVAAAARAIPNSATYTDAPSVQVPANPQPATECDIKSGSDSTENSVNLSDIYQLESFDEFIEAISNNGGISNADDSKRLELIKSQLSLMHKESHVKKSNPLLPNHSSRSSCIICTHLPQIFGSFSEICLPAGNTQAVPSVNLNDSDKTNIGDGHILATGILPKTFHNVDGMKDGTTTAVTTNKIILLNKGKSAKTSNDSSKARSLPDAVHENSASLVSASEDKQKNYLQFCSPSRNPLSRQNSSDQRRKSDHSVFNIPTTFGDDKSSELKVSDVPVGSSSSAPRAYPSVKVISVHPTLTPKKPISGDYVSPPSEVAYRSVTDDPTIREVPDYGNTPSIANPSSQNLYAENFNANNNSPSYDNNELYSVKLFDTLQKMHTKYFGSLHKKSRVASSKSIDDLEVEYSSPVLLKNEFIDRILLGMGESYGHDDDTSVFQTSCDDMSTSIEEEDLTELSNLLTNYKAANNASSSLRNMPTALSALKLFASKKREMTLSLRSLKSDRDSESTVYSNELSQNQVVPVSFESNVPSASIGMLVGFASLSDSRQHSNMSSLSFDSTWKRSGSGSVNPLKRNAPKNNSMVRNDLGLQTVIEKLELMKSQLSRNKAEHAQLISSKVSLNDHLAGEYSKSTVVKVPNDNMDSQDHESKSTLATEDASITRDQPSASIQESDICFRKSDEDLPDVDASVDIFVADHRDGHSDIVSPMTLDELFVSEDSESVVEKKAKQFSNLISRKSITGGKKDQDNLNKVLLDFLGKQQRDIEELKKTQENIHELLQKRDVYPQSQKVPSYVSDAAAQADHPDPKWNSEIAQSVEDDAFSHKVVDVESAENKNSNPTQCANLSEGSSLARKSSGISWGASVKESGESYPYNNNDADVSHNIEPSSFSTHSRQPSITDSTVSALTGCTGLTSADLYASNNNNDLRIMDTQGSSEVTPPKLQRLRFESFLEAAQSYSPNYKYSSKTTISPKSNNPLSHREMEEMVAFLMSKIEKYETKKLQWSEQELLDRDTQTIAIDPSDGRSKAFVEVIVKSAKNVPAMKKVTKSSDCYVEIKLVQARPPSSSASASTAIHYENKTESIFRTSVKQNTLYPDWMEDFKISDITDLLQDKLLVTLRDSSKGSSACIGPERDEIIGQGLLHFMGGENADENTNILLDQHMHCVNLTLSAPPHSNQQPHAQVRPPAARAPMAPMPAKKAPILSKRNSYPPTITRTQLSPPRRELGSNTSLSSSSVASDPHPHGCSVRLDVRLFFSKRKYWEHQQLDCTRLLYKLVGSSAPDLLQALYPQLKDFQAIHNASISSASAASSSSSSGITKLEIEKIRQMMLRETSTVASPDHLAGRDPESSAGLGGGTHSSSSISNTQKYSDIISGGSVSGMMKNMSHIRGLREKPLMTFTMHKGHQQSSRAVPSSSSSRISSSLPSSSSSPALRTGHRRNSLSGVAGGSIASGYTSASASSSSNNFGYEKQKHAAPYSNNAFVYSKVKVKYN